jgi:hypothetical protein
MLNFPDSPTVNQTHNPGGSGQPAWKWDGVKWVASTATGAPITVTGSTTLPAVAVASVNVNNTSGGPITITLPAAAANDQTYKIKDVAGNAGTRTITIVPTSGTIDGWPNYQIMSDYMAVEVYWAGGMWGTR